MAANVVMKKQKQLPDEPRRGGGSGPRWTPRFEEVVEKYAAGTPVLLATFDSRNGASRIKYRVTTGDVPVPGGADAWDVRAIQTRDGEGRAVGSELHVAYRGEG